MKEHPIIFSGEMVLAILEGRKHQTRRVVKPQPPFENAVIRINDDTGVFTWIHTYFHGDMKCPYGMKGDLLCVKETFARVPTTAYLRSGVYQTINPEDRYEAVIYKAGWNHCKPGRWRPSVHMPRWASRITLAVTDVRCERLRAISPEDKIAEGFCDCSRSYPCDIFYSCGEHCFMRTWDKSNAKLGYGWDTNPWVWVVSFGRISP
jgi:hypothetical protein